jgi:hypothetical protein
MRAKIQIINFTLNGITPFRLGVVERTLAQFGPYYFDPHWNDGYDEIGGGDLSLNLC